MSTSDRTLLIDGDILLYKYGFRHQDKIDWGDGQTSSTVDETAAKAELDKFIKDLLKITTSTDYKVCLSSSLNFRKQLLPTYKQNRKDAEKPELYNILKLHLKAKHPTLSMKALEADDVMGIYATSAKVGTYCVATIDKDLRQIPGLHYNWNKDEKPVEVSKPDGDYLFYRQTLTGDATDGYTGCPGIGPKKADKLLSGLSHEEMWMMIVDTYAAKGLTEDDALMQARMARILRYEDYNWDFKEPKLWRP
jgi:DNA polymerase-1